MFSEEYAFFSHSITVTVVTNLDLLPLRKVTILELSLPFGLGRVGGGVLRRALR